MTFLKQLKTDKHLFAALAVVALCILLAGCVPSLHPLFTAETTVFKSELLGTWKANPESEESWIFEKEDETSYRLTITEEDGKTSPFTARLVQLEKTLFLDLFPEGKVLEDSKAGAWFRTSLIPGHLIIKVGKIGDTLELSLLEQDWLKELIEKNPKAIEHTFLDKEYFILTARTPELQAFFKKHADTKEAWDDAESLLKQKLVTGYFRGK